MSKQLPTIDTSTDTFYSWIVKTNTLVTLANTELVTANNSANGATTTGKGFVIGTFGANTLACTTLRGGNTIANTALTITSNTTFTGETVNVNNGLQLSANSSTTLNSSEIATTTLSSNVLDSFVKDEHSTAKYIIAALDENTGDRQSSEIMLMHAANTVNITEYATLVSNGQFCTFVATTNATSVILSSTATSNLVLYSIYRTLVV